MIYIPLHNFFVFNGEIRPNAEFEPSENTGGVYEVLRVVQGIPLFMEDHLERFFISSSIAGKFIRFRGEKIAGFVLELIRQNEVSEGNILLSCKTNLKAFFIPHKYPGESLYEKGVSCGILQAERQNPNAKVFQTTVRQKADELMEKEGYYEVLLVDHLNRITEGSRSNVFFVKNNRLITPPGNEVLLGITRKKAIQAAKNEGISVSEQEVWLNDLASYKAAFITGTSPKILPLSKAGDQQLNSQNKLVQILREKYDELIFSYINQKYL